MTTTPGPLRAHLDAAVASAGLQLTKENVLFFRDAILNEAKRIRNDLVLHGHAATTIPLLGGDPVSYDASRAFPEKLKALIKEVEQFASDMEASARALDDTARRYGITEDEIARDFGHSASTTTSPQVDDVLRGSGVGEVVPALAPLPGQARPPDAPGLLLGSEPSTSAAAGGTPRWDQIINPHLHTGNE